MDSPEPLLFRIARWLTFGSAVAILFSIAASQILLALALAALLLSGGRMRLPRIWLPLGLFLLGTLISLALSPSPAAGLPQVRKIFVFTTLLVVFSTLRDMVVIRRLFLCWAGAGTLTALRGLVQFGHKVQEAHAQSRSFYEYYIAERITGFTSHWMTFGGQEMLALLMTTAFLFFACIARKRAWLWLLCAFLMALALLLGFTRSIWLASAGAGFYLLWFWKRVLALALPVALLLIAFLAPASIRERFSSMLNPGKLDSNQHRIVTWRTGLVMIRAHPWFGLGPEEVKLQFNNYVPADIPRPLPEGWYGHLHNIYLQYAAERGIPTMLLMLWLLGQILWDCLRRVWRLPPGRTDLKFVLHGAVAVVVATMIAGCFEYNLGDSEVLTMFLVVVGCAYAAMAIETDTAVA
ncbi:MAG TPA: O-antigen ligase family protein [Bryobacteraceae bacterium]|jgi:O-antigen ligase|nr:O-antigen ligase family protein [Bryobacteraceae bacterium]